jgi:hypothetical protein
MIFSSKGLKKMKEYRVYFLELDVLDINGSDIEQWHQDKELCEDAVDFIEQAEVRGYVFSVEGFIDSLNLQEFNPDHYFCFVTNKY